MKKIEPNTWIYEEEHQLNIHGFIPRKEDLRDGCIVMFHGGGWVGGSPSQFFYLANLLASNGYAVFLPQYRLEKSHGTSPEAAVLDSQKALQSISSRASALGLKPGRWAIGGSSAGGHLALCNAVVSAKDLGGYGDKTVRPNLLILFNPVVDTSLDKGYGGDRFTGDPLRYSPVHLPKPICPVLVFHGDRDELISLESVSNYCDTMEKCRLEIVPEAEHGFIYGMTTDTAGFSEIFQSILAFFEPNPVEAGFDRPSPTDR